uniref:Uncharacterized protein n=1 Tax=uncultured marine microorganism HF4000_ANIW137J11 TaxID=455532 RepID=B3T4P9_9ZZZZ|nr:hypothetical protein ALOHA_HF4000ANIW137J11ctg1g12 [uncultured marine microorganism HF4000_ANIW137J11]
MRARCGTCWGGASSRHEPPSRRARHAARSRAGDDAALQLRQRPGFLRRDEGHCRQRLVVVFAPCGGAVRRGRRRRGVPGEPRGRPPAGAAPLAAAGWHRLRHHARDLAGAAARLRPFRRAAPAGAGRPCCAAAARAREAGAAARCSLPAAAVATAAGWGMARTARLQFHDSGLLPAQAVARGLPARFLGEQPRLRQWPAANGARVACAAVMGGAAHTADLPAAPAADSGSAAAGGIPAAVSGAGRSSLSR